MSGSLPCSHRSPTLHSPLSFTHNTSVEYGELRQFLRLDEAPAPSTTDDDSALADLSADDAAKLAAELEEAEAKKVPIEPTSEGVTSSEDAAGVSEALVKQPGQAEAAEFETGMS